MNEAFKWYKLAADQGHAAGIHNLGIMYYYGYGCTKSVYKSYELVKKAMELGYEPAKKNLEIIRKAL